MTDLSGLAVLSEKVSHSLFYCTFLCAYYGRPAPITLAFRQPSIVISADVFILCVSSVAVNNFFFP